MGPDELIIGLKQKHRRLRTGQKIRKVEVGGKVNLQ